jgi:hypothetical protein
MPEMAANVNAVEVLTGLNTITSCRIHAVGKVMQAMSNCCACNAIEANPIAVTARFMTGK